MATMNITISFKEYSKMREAISKETKTNDVIVKYNALVVKYNALTDKLHNERAAEKKKRNKLTALMKEYKLDMAGLD
tara:strand:+ start:742 stop:972 length:231 start_codon:yes stop_codon:yes gene_type:complete